MAGIAALSVTSWSNAYAATLDDDDSSNVDAQSAPQVRSRAGRDDRRMYRSRIEPNWLASNDQFWYRNDLAQGGREFILVDAKKKTRELAFDHAAVAKAFGDGVTPDKLPVDRLEYNDQSQLVGLVGSKGRFEWNSTTGTLTAAKAPVVTRESEDTSSRNNRRNSATGADSAIIFDNRTTSTIEVFWINPDGTKQSYGKIEPGKVRDQHTFGGHRWLITNDKNETLGEVVAEDTPSQIVVDGRKIAPVAEPRRRNRDRGGEAANGRSPDGKWSAFIKEHNVWLKPSDSEDAIALSSDGREGLAYGLISWSPNSQTLIAFRSESVERGQVHLIRSSPEGGGRAQLESRPYVLPGDPFPKFELNVFRVESKEQLKPDVDRFEHEWQRPRVRWHRDGRRFTYEQTERGHARFRLIEVDATNAQVRNLIDEKSNTFIWTAHTENQSLSIINWLNAAEQILYATEKNGWRQLILIDANSGKELRELTPRGIVVRGIEKIDEENRKVWFSASGRDNQDPYLIHHAVVDLDSGKLVWLTQGNGTHTLQFSPDRRFAINTYSRVDMAPVSELRNMEDGELVCTLESADISELVASGWSAPQVFSAKGRDGQTDIWGIICRPKDFDPNKKYPVIEDIYAGPQGSFVPKSFSPSMRYESLTQLGFIVVKIDGMGTANRSKAFHDICWKNLKDGGFEDRILWMQSAAAKHPEMDLTRVGIYGTSAGGQNAGAAVLFHPEFYKVAVAASGCHDNRMDKASWNEQWMGYPVGPHYSECSNIDNAHRLQGKLFLIVGEMDTNVPTESTMRFADALIRANKDFDLLVVPNAGHGMGGNYGQRRMQDYFVRHLLQHEPPNRNAPQTTKITQTKALPTMPNSGVTDQSTAKGTKDTSAQTISKSVTVDKQSVNARTVTSPPDEFFALVRERDRKVAREFYAKYLDIDGLPVVAAEVVADEALHRTHDIVSHLLAGRPDVLKAMRTNGMYLIIIGKDQVYTDMPEYRDHPNPSFQNERVRGTGGKPTSFGEENLLSLPLDRYDDESIGVHEFCHTIDGALRSIDPDWSQRLRDTYQAARKKNLYENTYAGSNSGEYWAEICQAYFDCNRVNNWNHGPVGTREQLKAYDPQGYELVRTTFQLRPDQDWRYSYLRTLPCVQEPPAKFQLNPYYTKFTWAREFTIVGRKASDQSLLRANEVVRKMFAYRHDILKAFIADQVKLVVLGHDESLGDLPELRNDHARGSVDLLARYLEYSPQHKLLVVPEENITADPNRVGTGDHMLVRVLSDAIYQIVGTRPIDAEWDNRPRNVWQQYELRVQRLDVRFDKQMQSLFEQSTSKGRWKGTQAIHDRKAYWTAGVLAYFDAAGQSAAPIDSRYAIETRERLASYDPELYQWIDQTFAYPHRTDWRLGLPK
jgi:dipeptidyl aminopeptidase/acylaminoacyl peptidase